MMGRAAIRGFTLVELLVTIAMMGIMMAMVLPAIVAMRSAARRSQCASQLSQVSTAVANYQGSHGVYPAGVIDAAGPIQSTAAGYHHSWIVALLPYIEHANVDRQVDRAQSAYHDTNRPLRSLTLPILVCPADQRFSSASSFCGIHHDVEAPIDAGNSGVFFLNSRLAPDDIVDGLSHTIFLSEKLYEPGDLGWMSGTRATLRNVGGGINVTGMAPLPPFDADPYANGDGSQTAAEIFEANARAERDANRGDSAQPLPPTFVGGPASRHVQGAHFASGDGAVHFLSSVIDQKVLQTLAHRADQAPALDSRW